VSVAARPGFNVSPHGYGWRRSFSSMIDATVPSSGPSRSRDLRRSRQQLIAENALLRQQLIVRGAVDQASGFATR
jgi:hypothetical protein